MNLATGIQKAAYHSLTVSLWKEVSVPDMAVVPVLPKMSGTVREVERGTLSLRQTSTTPSPSETVTLSLIKDTSGSAGEK